MVFDFNEVLKIGKSRFENQVVHFM